MKITVLITSTLLGITLCSVFVSCTLKQAPKTQAVTISFPNDVTLPISSTLQNGKQGLSPRQEVLPTLLSEFQCIGVNVVADDISVKNTVSSCAPTAVQENLSEISQIVPKAKGSISIEIPAGYSRKIQVFGLTTSNGVCPSVDEVMAPIAGAVQKSKPYQLAHLKVDLTDDTVINAGLSWDPNSPKIAFCSTAFQDSASCAYSAKFGCSNWDQAFWAK